MVLPRHLSKRLLQVVHTKMGLDPDVWDQVEELIVEAGQGIGSGFGSTIRSLSP